MVAGSTIEYLFVNGNGASAAKEVLLPAMTCTNGNATYTNRLKVLGNTDVTLCNIYKTCNTCVPLSINNYSKHNFKITNNQNGFTIINNEFINIDNVKIFNIAGQKIFEKNNVMTNQIVNVEMSNQLYIISISKDSETYNYKIIN
jgi:hypothetical protein